MLKCYQSARNTTITFDSFKTDFYQDFVDSLSYAHIQNGRKKIIVGLIANTAGKIINHLRRFPNQRVFPKDFIFRLTREEWNVLQSQIASATASDSLRSQIVILKTGRGTHLKYLPYAFTEQGVAMLSSVLSSDKATSMNIAIMRVFVDVREAMLVQSDFRDQIKRIQEWLSEHDVQLNQLYEALENLLDEKVIERKLGDRGKNRIQEIT